MIEAAGGVLWRPAERGVEVALVHRPKYDDWSLPKGKLFPGEPPVLGALREVKEETGSDARLGRALGKHRYRVNGAIKRVRYWAMLATSDDFQPCDEVDAIEWLPPRAVRRRIERTQYEEVLDWFLADPRPSWPLILLRHASASSSATWPGDDEKRPLDELGEAQAQALTPLLVGYQAEDLWSADVTRCLQTISPYATSQQLGVQPQPLISESGYQTGSSEAHLWLLGAVADGRSIVVCTQRKAIPGLVKALCSAMDARPPAEASIPKGGAWVFHLARGADLMPDVAGMERLAPLVAAG